MEMKKEHYKVWDEWIENTKALATYKVIKDLKNGVNPYESKSKSKSKKGKST